jgi:phosphoribosylaminoimidazole-succinocarboxamide synthase
MSELRLRHDYRGKVRDLYNVGDDLILMVASDRLSAFDVVMDQSIPQKGRVLTALTNYWLNEFGPSVPTALVSCDPVVISQHVPDFANAVDLHGRTMLVRRATMVPLEFIVRGRLAGQAFEDYERTGTVFGMAAPAAMRMTDPFPDPIFTPSTKVDEGHDIYISLAQAAELVGAATLRAAESLCRDLFARASTKMLEAGLVLADTKFELGVVDGELVVCDEVITPDSSRIWLASEVHSGEVPPSFDKQPFRDWLAGQPWDRTPPPPHVPDDVVALTTRRYVACYENVTGRSLLDWYGR